MSTSHPTILAAILRGKVAQADASEDLLTAIAFGVLGWLPPKLGMIPFLGAMRPPIARLEDVVSVEVELWPWWDEDEAIAGAEPDVVLMLTRRTGTRALLVVECKRGSGKSGTGEADQLLRQAANALAVAAERQAELLGVLYLTEHVTAPRADIEASEREIAARLHSRVAIRWLSWRDLGPILRDAATETEGVSMLASRLCLDAAACLDRWGLSRYAGLPRLVTPPPWEFVTRFQWEGPTFPEWTFQRSSR